MPDMITVKEAAALLLITPAHVRRLAHAGKLVAQKTTPHNTRILRASVEAFINENNDRK